jgi:hypothetical protein
LFVRVGLIVLGIGIVFYMFRKMKKEYVNWFLITKLIIYIKKDIKKNQNSYIWKLLYE